MIRRVVTGAAVALLLAGCSPTADPSDGQSASPSPAQSTAGPREADLSAVCDALDRTVKLPTDGAVRYTATFKKPTGSSAPICDIEPEGTYYEVAARTPVFGRAEFDYGILTEAQIQQVGYPKYTPETAQNLLTLDQADPLNDQIPCKSEPCKDGIHGYQYNFRFQTINDDIVVIAKFDYITTDVKGDKRPQYRTQAIEAFTASMETITTELQ